MWSGNSSTKVLKDPFALFFYQCMVFILNRELGENIRGFVTLTPYILKKEKKTFSSFESEWNRLKMERGTRALTAAKEPATHSCPHQSDSHAPREDRRQHTHGVTVSWDLKLHLQTLGTQSPVVYLPLFSTCKVNGFYDPWCILV